MNYTQKDYYTEITRFEFYDFVDDKMINFNERDIKRLLQLNDKLKKDNYIVNYIYIEELLEIYECKDEYFIIYDYRYNTKYYKCD